MFADGAVVFVMKDNSLNSPKLRHLSAWLPLMTEKRSRAYAIGQVVGHVCLGGRHIFIEEAAATVNKLSKN